MRELFVLRHAQLDERGVPTLEGIAHAQAVGALLPEFEIVVSGGDAATGQTAFAMSGRESTADDRAGISPAFADYEEELRQFDRVPKKLDVAQYVEDVFAGGEHGRA